MMMSNLTDNDRSWMWTVGLTIALGCLAAYAFKQIWPNNSGPAIIWLGLAAGGIGGLVHEFGQSGGKLLFFKRAEDGVYLGALAGMFMGMVVGVLAVQGLFAQQPAGNQTQSIAAVGTANAGQQTIQPQAPSPKQPLAVEAFYTAFLAGLALKGFAEAVGGQRPVAQGTAPTTPGPLMTMDLPATPVPPTLH
ncbi:MAG TPA: hypothetical protein VFM05_14485 [Candidatus Saccharimonadales bacterium]|nr:hypothetical protein [Candidatus Saccharimonadales bacterium]